MTGAETVVTGAEAPVSGPSWARWGNDADDEYAQVAPDASDDDDAAPAPGRPTTLRSDGLVLELDDSDATEEGVGRAPPRRKPAAGSRRGLESAIAPATELESRLAGLQPVKRTYEIGQRVRHAEYGEGIIAGISGTGPRAVGTVIFDGAAGTRKFILGHGALQ
jgi:hypothetical protein